MEEPALSDLAISVLSPDDTVDAGVAESTLGREAASSIGAASFTSTTGDASGESTAIAVAVVSGCAVAPAVLDLPPSLGLVTLSFAFFVTAACDEGEGWVGAGVNVAAELSVAAEL
jgi:hypothetical protein